MNRIEHMTYTSLTRKRVVLLEPEKTTRLRFVLVLLASLLTVTLWHKPFNFLSRVEVRSRIASKKIGAAQ